MNTSVVHPSGLSTQARADIVERIFLAIVLGWFIARMVGSLKLEPLNIALIVSESLPVFFVMIRKPGQIAAQRRAWIIAVIGTFAPLFVLPIGAELVTRWLSGSIMVAGLMFSIAAKLALNRRFGIVAAYRGLTRSGPYRLVRHPMYLGYMVTHVGFLIGHLSPFNVALYCVTWTAFMIRIGYEERALAQDPDYQEFVAAVPYRLIYGVY